MSVASQVAENRLNWQESNMTNQPERRGGGIFIVLAIAIGTAVGSGAGRPVAGTVAGAVIGAAIALAIWLHDRRGN